MKNYYEKLDYAMLVQIEQESKHGYRTLQRFLEIRVTLVYVALSRYLVGHVLVEVNQRNLGINFNKKFTVSSTALSRVRDNLFLHIPST